MTNCCNYCILFFLPVECNISDDRDGLDQQTEIQRSFGEERNHNRYSHRMIGDKGVGASTAALVFLREKSINMES
ncbi:unnamed protein product [Arabidopsis thaliana]|uniref:Uncharacterized protein n=1 Tax=Arabidopsis thaliana TaxID=3702 RepID=A0A5S9XRZ0_ARATH|nr:unnamed protein product [Arabidopsis thaliana]